MVWRKQHAMALPERLAEMIDPFESVRNDSLVSPQVPRHDVEFQNGPREPSATVRWDELIGFFDNDVLHDTLNSKRCSQR
jgi:hypothetical protein